MIFKILNYIFKQTACSLITYYLLPITYYLLPTTYYLLPSHLIIYLLIKFIITCCTMSYPLLFFFQRNYIFHHRYFLMEIAYIHRLVIYQLKKSPQLSSGKFTWKQLKQHGRIELHKLTDIVIASLIIRLWSKANVITSFKAIQQA